MEQAKATAYYNLMNKWLFLRNNNISILDYFELNDSKSYAIYGFGEMGKRVIEEFQIKGVTFSYVVDKQADCYFTDFIMKSLGDKLPDADVMIVSQIYEYDSIFKELSIKFGGEIVSLEKIINSLWISYWEKRS